MNTTNIVHRPRSHVGKWQIESKSVFGNKPSDADTPNRMAGTGFVSEIWVDAGRVQQRPPPRVPAEAEVCPDWDRLTEASGSPLSA